MAFRDARPSMIANRDALEAELEEAEEDAVRRRSNLPSLFFRLFPMLDNFSHTAAALRGDQLFVFKRSREAMLLALLGPLSVAALPLALLLHGKRSDVRGLRRAKRRVRRLKSQLANANRMLEAPRDE